MVEHAPYNYWLKCNYLPGQFSNEYFVKFKGSENSSAPLKGVFVSENNLIQKDKEEGSALVKIILARRDEKTSQILIPSITDSGTFFKVSNEDIVRIGED